MLLIVHQANILPDPHPCNRYAMGSDQWISDVRRHAKIVPVVSGHHSKTQSSRARAYEGPNRLEPIDNWFPYHAKADQSVDSYVCAEKAEMGLELQ
jgi:hypothetical protein